MELVDDVKELQEDRGEASIGAVAKVAPLVEPVTEGQPLLLYEGAESLQGPVVGVKAKLGYTRHLSKTNFNSMLCYSSERRPKPDM